LGAICWSDMARTVNVEVVRKLIRR
jgi:hypothetical protein